MFLRKGLCPLPKGTLHLYDEGGDPDTSKALFLKHFVSEIKPDLLLPIANIREVLMPQYPK